LFAVVIVIQTHAFVPSCQPFTRTTAFVGDKRRMTVPSVLWYADSPVNELSGMKASDMKKELESYGISTKSMFDKKEFENALKEARVKNGLEKEVTTMNSKEKKKKNGVRGSSKTKREKLSSKWKNVASATKQALDNLKENPFPGSTSTEKTESPATKSSPSTTTTSSSSNDESTSREERYKLALEEGASMKLSNLKKELQDRGISTNSFFEKSDLVKAYANAIADNSEPKAKNSTKNKNTGSRHGGSNNERERFDPYYKDVIMHPFDPSSILPGDVVIDITETVR